MNDAALTDVARAARRLAVAAARRRGRFPSWRGWLTAACGAWLLALTAGWAAAEEFHWTLRSRVETGENTGRFHTLRREATWDGRTTAFIVCDMWDLHHCLNAVRRVQEMAPRMNQVLQAARQRGALVIHAPSSCMDAYRDHPARLRAQRTPRAAVLPEEIEQWCDRIPAEEQGEYPLDQSDGGEDDDPLEHQQWAEKLRSLGRDPRAPWKSQIAALDILEEDYISDNGAEIWSILQQQGVRHVVLLGVHTNMCVLGRPFGLRRLASNGMDVVLMRDMTDTMYNPQRAPFVSHFTGTDLIVEHIEKWVCPTVTSNQLLGGEPFRFSHDRRPHVVMLIAEQEYRTNESLPPFVRQHLGDFRVSLVFADEAERNTLPGVEVVGEADVLLISVRRRVLPPEQMRWIRQHIERGKPVVGIRTANHAFVLRDAAPAGLQDWPNWDAEIFGGSYSGHHGAGPAVKIAAVPESTGHPILQGVDAASLEGRGSLYKVNPLNASAAPLLQGTIADAPAESIAWTHVTRFGGKAFYTSLGHEEDFQQPAFQRLLANAVAWAAAP